jgi:hypothetical protein
MKDTGGKGGAGADYLISGELITYAAGGDGEKYSSSIYNGSLGGGGDANKAGGNGIIIISYPSIQNGGVGGTITYTNSNNENPVSKSVGPYDDGYTIHTFTGIGGGYTFTII